MSIDRDDLLSDPLLPSIKEERPPAPTLSELFNTESVVLGAVKSQVSNALDWMEKTQQAAEEKYDEVYDGRKYNQRSVDIVTQKTPAAPKFDFDDPSKNVLASNAWEHMECRLAGGEYNFNPEATMKNIGFMLRLNMSTYDKLPHKNFIGFQPMNQPNQIVYHNEFTPTMPSNNVEDVHMTKHEITTYCVEAKSRRLHTSVMEEILTDMHSAHLADLEDEIIDMTAHNISGELYREMIKNINTAACVSTVTAETNTPPSALDIIASIHEASDEIAKCSPVAKRANWIIMGPQMAAILLETGKNAVDTSDCEEAPHVSLLGTMHGMKVYMDTEGAVKSNDILVGRQGDHTFSQGMAYCPHVLAIDSGVTTSPTTFAPVKTLMTRGSYFTPNDADSYFHKIQFKEAPVVEGEAPYKGRDKMDVGYFYCPYVPLMVTDPNPGDDLMDIVMKFGANEKKTIAELFSKRIII